MLHKKKIPVVTEVLGGNYKAAVSGALILPINYALGFIEIIKESFSAVNLKMPETVELQQGEIFYGINRIEEIRLIGYDSALLNDSHNNLSETVFQTRHKPMLKIVETSDGEKILPNESERCHFAFYIFTFKADNKKISSVLLSWNLPETIVGYDPEIYEGIRLTLFFQNSCTLLAAAGFLLETETGLKFLEDELGKLPISDLEKMLKPVPPAANSPNNKIEITGEYENLIYNYQTERFAYDIGYEYFRTIKFDDLVVHDIASKEGWSEARAKAVICVKFAVAMDEYITAALQIYPNFTIKALQIFVKHLIGEGFWKHILYSFETPLVDFKGKKSDVRDRQIEPLFDDLRALLKAQKGRPKNSFKKRRRPDKGTAETIKTAIIDLCRSSSDPSEDIKITQNDIAERLNVSDRTVRNMVKSSGEEFVILREDAIREFMKETD